MGILILTGVFLSTERQYITAFQKSPDNRALFMRNAASKEDESSLLDTISWLAKRDSVCYNKLARKKISRAQQSVHHFSKPFPLIPLFFLPDLSHDV